MIKKVSFLFILATFIGVTYASKVDSSDMDNFVLSIYCRDTKEIYYLENEKEIKQVLRLLPKIPNIVYDIKHVLEWGLFGPYPDYSLMVKKNGKVLKEFCIDIDNRVWVTDKSFLTTWLFPKKNIEKIISKMHKGIRHTETIENLSERRYFIERLMSDNNVLYIDDRAESEFKRHMGAFYLYVPGSKDEKIDYRDIVRNLRNHYGDTLTTASKEIHDYTGPELKRYIEETQEFEYEMRWTKAMYDKIDIYRKGEFREENLPIHHTFEYYTKD